MGNTSSSRHSHDDSVDYGQLTPQGVYTGPQDWNQSIVAQLIVDRKLAPFYRPLEDYDPSWDTDRILAARKDLTQPSNTETTNHPHPESSATPRPPTIKHTRGSLPKETARMDEAVLYKDAVECPICFLYYPPNINRSRCCDHPICTECFVQIKRSEPSPTHLSSEPTCCPYCVRENFGVTYEPPSWRAGTGSENFNPARQEALQPAGSVPHTIRRKSFGADAPEVVTTDQIRPDWEEKLAAVKETVRRRANRRIIMRQVGDRLVPVGITSGRIHAIGQDLPGGGDAHNEGRGSRRRRGERGGQGMDIAQFLGLSGQDIEELMVMEAMRLSLAEHEESQRRQENDSNRERQSNNGTPQSDNAPAPMSYVLSHPRSPAARDSNSSSSPSSVPPTALPGSGTLRPSGALTSFQSHDSLRRSRTPSPHPDADSNHQRSLSALESLIVGSAANAGVIAGINRDATGVHDDDPDSVPNSNGSLGPSGSEGQPEGTSPVSKHETAVPRTWTSTSAPYTALSSSSEARSLVEQPLLPAPSISAPSEDRSAESNSTGASPSRS